MAWEQLLGMIQEARDWETSKASEPPTQCPHDYAPLKPGPNGELFCPWAGDYEWPRDGRLEL